MQPYSWRFGRFLAVLGIVAALIGCAEKTVTKSSKSTSGAESPAAVSTASTPATESTSTSPSTDARLPAAGDERVRIGAWNIEWLGTPASRSGIAKGSQQSPEDLADYIIASKVSVLGLAEIARDDSDESWTNSILTKTFQIVSEKTGGKWTHRLSPAHSGRNQVVGIAWDAAKVHPQGELRPLLETGPESAAGTAVWSRPPPALTFRTRDGMTDFVVIAIHMKSNFGGSGGKFVEHRGLEAKALVEAAQKTIQDGDIVIIGDSNCEKHNEPAPLAYEAAGWIDLNAGDQRTFWQGNGALDRVFVPKNQPEFADRHFEVFRDAYLHPHNLTVNDFKKRFSDHFMVITEVRVMKDDD